MREDYELNYAKDSEEYDVQTLEERFGIYGIIGDYVDGMFVMVPLDKNGKKLPIVLRSRSSKKPRPYWVVRCWDAEAERPYEVYVHRVVYAFLHRAAFGGDWCIDHRDGKSWNNRELNLAQIKKSENSKLRGDHSPAVELNILIQARRKCIMPWNEEYGEWMDWRINKLKEELEHWEDDPMELEDVIPYLNKVYFKD